MVRRKQLPLRSFLVVLTLALGGAVGCSLIVNFDEANCPGLADRGCPCADDADCLSGYSCQINSCVADYSVGPGRTCSQNVQCNPGLLCATPDFVCRPSCERSYGEGGQCDASSVCGVRNDPTGQPSPVCLPANCPCDGGKSCITVDPGTGAGLCLDSCAVNCSGGSCAGQCAAHPSQNCQPMGPQQRLACAPLGEVAQGEVCNLVDLFCDRRSACVKPADGSDGRCRAYCQQDTDCGGAAGSCSPQTDYSICVN